MATTTKIPFTFAAMAAALFAFSSPASAEVKVDKPKIDITIQKTPRFQISGPKEKRDTQKVWIEVEVEFKADDRSGDPKEEFIGDLEFKYFIALKAKDNKTKAYTLTVNHTNILKGETLYSVAYISPMTIAKIMGKDAIPNKSSIEVAVEIRHGGTLKAGDATKSPSSKWWNTIPNVDGMVLNKNQTPFAPLWWDRYAEIEGN